MSITPLLSSVSPSSEDGLGDPPLCRLTEMLVTPQIFVMHTLGSKSSPCRTLGASLTEFSMLCQQQLCSHLHQLIYLLPPRTSHGAGLELFQAAVGL